MFTTEKVQAFVQRASLEGKDDSKFVRFTFYVTPITYELAKEVSAIIAANLFRLDAVGAPHPVLEVSTVSFEIGEIPLQTMKLYPATDVELESHGTLLTAVQIRAISARKVFPDDPNFTLIFNAELPKDDLSFAMMGKYFREKVFVTFAEMQKDLFPKNGVQDTIQNPKCNECDEPATRRDSEGTHLCAKHVRAGKGEVKLLTSRETPKEAQKRIEKEAAAKAASGPSAA